MVRQLNKEQDFLPSVTGFIGVVALACELPAVATKRQLWPQRPTNVGAKVILAYHPKGPDQR